MTNPPSSLAPFVCPHCGQRLPDSRKPLTDRQRETYDTIRRYRDEFGVTPTYTVLASILGLNSLASVSDLVHALRRKGWLLIRKGGCRQAIQLAGE